jgi:DNA repair protein RecN (Recombination protein N)
MPNVRFDIQVKLSETYYSIKMKFNFYLRQIKELILGLKVASGGEMSRIMLAVKAILAQYSKLPTLILTK